MGYSYGRMRVLQCFSQSLTYLTQIQSKDVIRNADFKSAIKFTIYFLKTKDIAKYIILIRSFLMGC